LTSSLSEVRTLRKLTRLLMDRQAALPGSEEAWEEHLAQNPDDRPLAEQIERMWDDIGRVPAPELRLQRPLPPHNCRPCNRPRRRKATWCRWPRAAAGRCRWALRPALARCCWRARCCCRRATRPPPPAQKFAAGAQTRKLHLADGSSITLAPGAEVEVRLTPSARAAPGARRGLFRGEA
jgi:ferric-dicitrate binding protein FerR (iron transport regulator)